LFIVAILGVLALSFPAPGPTAIDKAAGLYQVDRLNASINWPTDDSKHLARPQRRRLPPAPRRSDVPAGSP
jgi:hypothetical protein